MNRDPLPSADQRSWIETFISKHGRAPRVLHIGNVANNAYNNAKLLNRVGLDCDVICYDYYHIMGCPEWEDADFDGAVRDQYRPNWIKINLNGFQRPRWFAQGPLDLCVDYLVARRSGAGATAKTLWKMLSATNGTLRSNTVSSVLLYLRSETVSSVLLYVRSKGRQLSWDAKRYIRILALDPDFITKARNKARAISGSNSRYSFLHSFLLFSAAVLAASCFRLVLWPYSLYSSTIGSNKTSKEKFDATVASLTETFPTAFPDRADKLLPEDLEGYRNVLEKWRKLFAHYDIVQAYATDPIIPLLAGKRPYVAFEHGTLRDFTRGDKPVCRLTALAYNQADHVFITNGDCLDYAHAIGVRRCSAMLHPIDESVIRDARGEALELRGKYGVRYLFFCPLRHDWDVKGTDKYIRALPLLAEVVEGSFKVLMTRWGTQVSDSIVLARSLGVTDKIEWIEPLPKAALYRMQTSVDILFDQIALPHFGSTAPQGIAAGVPVIMSYEPASTQFIVDEPAPILAAWTPEDICGCVMTALDQRWLKEYRERAAQWTDRYHSARLVVEKHLEAYARLLPA